MKPQAFLPRAYLLAHATTELTLAMTNANTNEVLPAFLALPRGYSLAFSGCGEAGASI